MKTIVARYARHAVNAHGWTRSHQRLLQWTFWICFWVVVAIDLMMVLALHVESITSRIRDAQDQHTTLTAFGMLVGFGIAYLVWPYRVTVAMVGLLMGHLFTG